MKSGLVNALKIDDTDLSIGYKHSGINNAMDLIPVKNIKELDNLFQAGNDVFRYDSRHIFSLIFNDGTEHSIQEMCSKVVFLKISTYQLKKYKSEILIALDNNHYMSDDSMDWTKGGARKLIIDPDSIVKNDIDVTKQNYQYKGYECNQLMINEINKFNQMTDSLQLDRPNIELTAINYCNNLTINILDNSYQGYLPCVYQLKILNKYFDLINYVLYEIGFEKIRYTRLWSCTEISRVSAYCLTSRYNIVSSYKSSESAYVLPFFKKLK